MPTTHQHAVCPNFGVPLFYLGAILSTLNFSLLGTNFPQWAKASEIACRSEKSPCFQGTNLPQLPIGFSPFYWVGLYCTTVAGTQ